MFAFLKRPLYVLANKIRRSVSFGKKTEEKWIADFSGHQNSPFDIKSETSHDAYLELPSHQRQANSPLLKSEKAPGGSRRRNEGGALVLGLKKANCIAWADAQENRFRDQVIEAKFSLDSMGGYAAAGILFRIIEDDTYYLALVSSKGYFRLDMVRNAAPLPLIGWTEISGFESSGTEHRVNLCITAYGDHLIFIVNDRWTAEIKDAAIPEGRIGFALASYEPGPPRENISLGATDEAYVCAARLEYLSVDSDIGFVKESREKWNNSREITAESRLRLAETFAAMNNAEAALFQIYKAWESREIAARSVMATYTESRARRELLLASRMARRLGKYGEANEYTDACLEQGTETAERKEALREKAKILFETEKFEELKNFIQEHIARNENDPALPALFGHACWRLKEYASAAAAYDRAFELDEKNGIYAVNAAAIYEEMGKRQRALKRYLTGGRAFLGQDNYAELGELIPKLLALGEKNWEARALAGKWAFGVEDFDRAETELALSEKIRRRKRTQPAPDPAVSFLRGLLLVRKGRRQEASRFLEEAAHIAPGYGLFRFRLAENRYLSCGDAQDSLVTQELKAALDLMPDDGWVNNFAAQISLAVNDLDSAGRYLEKAALTFGEVPAIRVNRGVLAYLRGSLDDALKILNAEKRDDPEGLLSNCAGNLLVRSGDFEKADLYYRKALNNAPGNLEYLANRASCLIELGYFGQAEELLAQAPNTPEILELISYAASKKGEYNRAESASLAALEIAPDNIPSLFALGWIYCNTSRWDDLEKIILRLDKAEIGESDSRRREELRKRLDEGTTQIVGCARCKRKWKIKRKNNAVPRFTLHAMPPDEFPAGTCPQCGKTYCIGCAKKHIDKNGRFICSQCKTNLKLSDDGLKKIIHDWAVSAIPAEESPKRGRSSKKTNSQKN